jgi:hypothetical protein
VTTEDDPAGVLATTLAAATGRHRRNDPVLPRTGGPAGNAVLTAWTGLTLLVLSVAELLTLFDVRGLITWHVAIGALLVPPALMKTGATTWRMVRYYRGNAPYREAGPPPLLLRLLGPVVVLSTLSLLATGALLLISGQKTSQDDLFTVPFLHVNWIFLHQATFAVWASATGLHLIGRLVPALQVIARAPLNRVPGGTRRALAAATVLVAAVPLAVLAIHSMSSWGTEGPRFEPGSGTGTSSP